MLSFNIETLTLEQFEDLIASADDTQSNQLRVDKNGKVFITQEVGSQNIDNIQFRYETFDAHNGYVGKEASADTAYVEGLFNSLKLNWKNKATRVIDFD